MATLGASLHGGIARPRRGIDDENLSGAVPASAAAHLPSAASQYRTLQTEIARSRPAVESARRNSDALHAQAARLQQRLIATAARVQQLEEQKTELDAEVASLSDRSVALSKDFERQRGEVAGLLAILERVQHDMPPVMAVRAGDALAAAHSAMLLGATLPRLYGAVADLARRLDLMNRTRAALVARRALAARTSANLVVSRGEIDHLLAIKSREADRAGAKYGDLAAKLGVVASQAADLETLLRRVAALRTARPPQKLVVVAAHPAAGAPLRRQSLRPPVTGRMMPGDGEAGGAHAPGVSFLSPPAAQVVAPADSEVLFAGAYQKTGLVLILRGATGYDLVLAGLERIDVQAGDELLAGEPVGRMPRSGTKSRLYFELRLNGKGVSPAPWLAAEPGKVM